MTSGPNISDGLLLEQVAAGDESAFGELVRRHGDRLLAQARKVEPSMAEDVVQMALMNAYRAIRSGVRPESVDAWLGAIVHNAAVSELRRGRGREPLAEAPVERSAFDEAADRDRIRRAVAATKELPARERRALTAHAFEGRGHREIAAASGISEGSVRMAIHRARRRLRAAVPVLVPVAILEGARRAAGRVREAGALGGAAVAASVAAVVTAAIVAGGVPGGGDGERSTVAVAQSPSPPPEPASPPNWTRGDRSDEGDGTPKRQRSKPSGERRQQAKGDASSDGSSAAAPDGPPGSTASTTTTPASAPPPSPPQASPPSASPPPSTSGPSSPPPQPPPTNSSPTPPPPQPAPPPPEPSPPPAKCPGLVSCLLDEVGKILNP